MLLIYDATLQKWTLQNPATGVTLVLPEASEATKGIIEIATQAEVTNGTDATKAVSPKYLKTELDKKATNDALALKAPSNNPTFTGAVVVPTPTQSNHAATKAYVDGKIASPKAYVTETWQSGENWYRVWSDGFVEQSIQTGTIAENNITGTTVTLLKSYKTTSYSVYGTPIPINGTSGAGITAVRRETSKVIVSSWGKGTPAAIIYCCGY